MEKKDANNANENLETQAKENVRIKVVQTFRDKFNKAVRYEVGQELEFEAERANDVVNRNLAEFVEPLG